MAYIDKIGKARVHDFFCDDTRQSLVVVGNIVNSVCFNTILCRSVALVVLRCEKQFRVRRLNRPGQAPYSDNCWTCDAQVVFVWLATNDRLCELLLWHCVGRRS